MSKNTQSWRQVFSRLVNDECRLREALSFTHLNLQGIKHLYNYRENRRAFPRKKLFSI